MAFTRQILLVLTTSLVLIACNTSKKGKEKPKSEGVSVAYEMKQFNRKAENCKAAACAEVSINYPQFQIASENAPKINKMVENHINQKIIDYLMKTPANATTEELMNAFLDGYAEFKANFPESITPWYLQIDASVSYESSAFITVSVSTSAYAGGAHPNRDIEYLNIATDGKPLDRISLFFNEPNKLKEQAEAKFRTQNGLAPDENLADKGFMFDDNRFQLSDNFGFNSQGLILYYNPYEIAAYSEGAIVITLPFSELANNFRY